MGADPIIYCLEQVTDYAEFERFCHALMAASGYNRIEPLGGFKDKGRDAIHVSASDAGDVTIFAYSVREDWQRKLIQDADSVRTNGHACQTLVFLCTSSFTAGERDNAVQGIADEYGWDLQIYGLERLRALLVGAHPEIIAQHPHIFCPPFFPQAGGLSLSPSRDYLVVDHSPSDDAIAKWLSRRLALEGYLTWCQGLAPLAGASLSATVESLVNARAFRLLSVVSSQSRNDTDLTARRTLAATTNGGILVPIYADAVDRSELDAKTRSVEGVSFAGSWFTGLTRLLELLEATRCPRTSADPTITARSFVAPELVLDEPELVVSNRYVVHSIPDVIYRFVSSRAMDSTIYAEAAGLWSFRKVDDKTFLSFWPPHDTLKDLLGMKGRGGAIWRSVHAIDGIAVRNLVPELIKKALYVSAHDSGLEYCADQCLWYFPDGRIPSNRLYFTKPDGTRTFIGVAGQRTYWRPNLSEVYRHSLAPVFSVEMVTDHSMNVLVRPRIRLADDQGKSLSRRKRGSRRKHLCRNWWNDDWLHRSMAIMQFLSADGEHVDVGESEGLLRIAAHPESWMVAKRLNEAARQNGGDDMRDDALTYGEYDAEDEDDELEP